jgi:hypothetical protein
VSHPNSGFAAARQFLAAGVFKAARATGVGLLISTSLAYAGVMSIRAERPDLLKVLNGDSSWNVMMSGEIDAGAAARLEGVLRTVGGDGADIYINSPGGSLLAGMQIGRLIRKAGATTRIGTLSLDKEGSLGGKAFVKHVNGFCHSACSLAFLGGLYRYADSGDMYGVHRFSSSSSPSSNDMDAAQVISAAVAAYIREMDVDPALFDYMVERGKDGIRILTTKELTLLNVVNNGRQRPIWSIESIEEGLYLRGVQETVYGRGKAAFLCSKGRVVYLSLYQAGATRAREIASGRWYHSVLVDGKSLPLDQRTTARATGDEISTEIPLSREQTLAIASSASVGHAMQITRDAPSFVGYTINIPSAESVKVSSFLKNCSAAGK